MSELRGVRSASGIQRNSKDYVARLKRRKTVLAVDGHKLVVQTAESYQALLDRVERRSSIQSTSGIESLSSPTFGIGLDVRWLRPNSTN